MSNKYEAAEVIVVGRAQDTILGIKDMYVIDNRADPEEMYRDSSLALFEE